MFFFNKNSKEIIPDNNHVVRHCSASRIDDEGFPTGGAFVLRRENDKLHSEEGYGLSVNWLEYYGDDKTRTIEKIKKDLNRKLTTEQRLALLNVGRTKIDVQEKCSIVLEFFRYKKRHKKEAPSHSLVKGYEPNQEEVQDAIALSVIESLPAK